MNAKNKSRESKLESLCNMMVEVISKYDFKHIDYIPYFDSSGKLNSGRLGGMTDNDDKLITIANRASSKQLYKVVLHEVFHAYSDLHLLDLNEKEVDYHAAEAYKIIYQKKTDKRKK
jgi:hypothetical protein